MKTAFVLLGSVAGTERRYLRFYRDCRSGKTTAYAEPWASCWGHHGGKTDDRWCSPPQWMYWRLLSDLNCGVAHIALYASDLRVAIDGTCRQDRRVYADGNKTCWEVSLRFADQSPPLGERMVDTHETGEL